MRRHLNGTIFTPSPVLATLKRAFSKHGTYTCKYTVYVCMYAWQHMTQAASLLKLNNYVRSRSCQ